MYIHTYYIYIYIYVYTHIHLLPGTTPHQANSSGQKGAYSPPLTHKPHPILMSVDAQQ